MSVYLPYSIPHLSFDTPHLTVRGRRRHPHFDSIHVSNWLRGAEPKETLGPFEAPSLPRNVLSALKIILCCNKHSSTCHASLTANNSFTTDTNNNNTASFASCVPQLLFAAAATRDPSVAPQKNVKIPPKNPSLRRGCFLLDKAKPPAPAQPTRPAHDTSTYETTHHTQPHCAHHSTALTPRPE